MESILRILDDGDILNIDVTAIVEGYHGDTSRMFYVGEVPVKAKNYWILLISR